MNTCIFCDEELGKDHYGYHTSEGHDTCYRNASKKAKMIKQNPKVSKKEVKLIARLIRVK